MTSATVREEGRVSLKLRTTAAQRIADALQAAERVLFFAACENTAAEEELMLEHRTWVVHLRSLLLAEIRQAGNEAEV